MLNNFKNFKIYNSIVSKHQIIEKKIKTKTTLYNFFSEDVKEKLVKNYANNKLGKNLFLNFDLGITNFKKFTDNDLMIPVNNDNLVEEVDLDFSVEVWTPNLFFNREQVLNSESLGNLEILKKYQEILFKLRLEIPEQDWVRLFESFRFDIGQVMRHLIIVINYNNGEKLMIHFTHGSMLNKWVMTANNILVQENLGVQQLVVSDLDGQIMSNPVVISEEFYNKFFIECNLMRNVTVSEDSQLNEVILTKLGLNNNIELGEYVLNFLKFVKDLKVLRGVNLFQEVNITDTELIELDNYYDSNNVNLELRSALDCIFYFFYNKGE